MLSIKNAKEFVFILQTSLRFFKFPNSKSIEHHLVSGAGVPSGLLPLSP
jgi:hypothetical protein